MTRLIIDLPNLAAEDADAAVARLQDFIVLLDDDPRLMVEDTTTDPRAIYVPPVPATDDEPAEPSRLQCPACESDYVVQVDIATRWNDYDEDVTTPGLIVWGTDGQADFETDHYLCADCQTNLAPPEGTELHADHPDHIEEDYA